MSTPNLISRPPICVILIVFLAFFSIYTIGFIYSLWNNACVFDFIFYDVDILSTAKCHTGRWPKNLRNPNRPFYSKVRRQGYFQKPSDNIPAFCWCKKWLVGPNMNFWPQQLKPCHRWFSRDIIVAVLVDENKRSLISFFCSSTRSHTFLYCYWCLQRLVENVLFGVRLPVVVLKSF